MLVKIRLHRTGQRADWELIGKHKRNIWQRVAFSTKGIATPANITSVVGAALVGLGLWYIYIGYMVWGIICIAFGRLADILDGAVAQATGTKSSVGEALDASIDKVTIIAALIVFAASDIVPVLAIVLIALRNSANIAISLTARAHKKMLHPSREGKFAAAAEWGTIMFFILAALARTHNLQALNFAASAVAYIVLGITILLGIFVIKSYYSELKD